MLRVLYLVSTLKRAGPVNQLYNLLSNIDREVIEPFVLTLSGEEAESRWADFYSLGIRMESLSLSRPGGVFMGRKRLKQLVDQLKPDLLHSQGLRSDHLASDFKNKMPVIATLRNYPELDYPMTYGTLTGRLMVRQHIKALKSLNCCVGVSEAVTNNAKSRHGLTNMVTIHNGVETGFFFRVSAEQKRELRKRLNLPEKAVLWITTGHLSERKNPLLIIRAWQNSLIDQDNQHLIFIGEGKLGDACRDATGAAKNITFVGRTEDVVSYLQAADFYVSASRAEGFPNAVLEAMACGLPVLLSDISPHREVWEFKKKAGRLFKTDSEASLIEELKLLVSKDYEELAINAESTIKERFNAETMSQKYQDLYSKAAAKRGDELG